jgi:hypothetical protein
VSTLLRFTGTVLAALMWALVITVLVIETRAQTRRMRANAHRSPVIVCRGCGAPHPHAPCTCPEETS